MTMGKYGEPWKMTGLCGNREIENETGDVIIADGMMLDPKDIKRIVACVNACEGIEKPEMIRPLLERCMIFLDDCYHDETVKEIAELLGK